MKIRPNHLQVGDTVGVIALCSPLEMEELQDKLDLLTSLGLNYKLGQTVGLTGDYLAGTDDERLADLHQMVKDPEIKAIFCLRGGYGAARIVDQIDYPSFEENPKIFWGFSDVTVFHLGIAEYANLVTFHGPMLSSVISDELSDVSKKMFKQLFSPFEIVYDETYSPLYTIVPGVVRGEITGGNLHRIVGTLGTKFEVNTRGKVLLLEEVGESLEKIDGMLNHLRLAGKLKQAEGFVIGSFTKVGDGVTEEDVWKLLEEYLAPLKKPVLAGFQIGHCEPNIGIPLGVDVILDATQKKLHFLPGVQ